MPSHPVALSEFGSSLSPLVLAHRALDDPLILVVVALELARGMYFQVPIRLCACVAEGVVDPPRLEDERAGRGDHDLAADVERQLALQHEGALVLSRVGVRRDHRARWEAYLDDRKGAAEVLRCHLVGYVQDGEVGTFSWTDEDFLVLCRHKALAPFRSASLMGDPTLPMQAGCQLALFGASNFGEYPSLLKNSFALYSAPGSGAESAVFVVYWTGFEPLSDRRLGRQLLFQQADPFYEVGWVSLLL